MQYFNRLYRKLGVLLTDDDLAGESIVQRPAARGRRAVAHRRPAAGERRRGGRVPSRLHQPRGRAAAVDRAEARRRVQLRHQRSCLRAGSCRACQGDALALRGRSRAVATPGDGVRRRRDGRMAATADAGSARRLRLRPRYRPQEAEEPKRRAGPVRRRRGGSNRPGDGIGQREEPRPAPRRTDRHRPDGRHRRAEVRRPVDRPDQGLRLRLGSHAGVRGQHRALPPVRTRPHPLHPAQGRSRIRPPQRAAASRQWRPKSANWSCNSCTSTPRCTTPSRSTALTGCARTCSIWRRPSRRSTRRARC